MSCWCFLGRILDTPAHSVMSRYALRLKSGTWGALRAMAGAMLAYRTVCIVCNKPVYPRRETHPGTSPYTYTHMLGWLTLCHACISTLLNNRTTQLSAYSASDWPGASHSTTPASMVAVNPGAAEYANKTTTEDTSGRVRVRACLCVVPLSLIQPAQCMCLGIACRLRLRWSRPAAACGPALMLSTTDCCGWCQSRPPAWQRRSGSWRWGAGAAMQIALRAVAGLSQASYSHSLCLSCMWCCIACTACCTACTAVYHIVSLSALDAAVGAAMEMAMLFAAGSIDPRRQFIPTLYVYQMLPCCTALYRRVPHCAVPCSQC